MAKPRQTRFYVQKSDKAAALAHFAAKGISPKTVETDDEGLVVFVFATQPDDAMSNLIAALPLHLSAKVGIVVNGNTDLPKTRKVR